MAYITLYHTKCTSFKIGCIKNAWAIGPICGWNSFAIEAWNAHKSIKNVLCAKTTKNISLHKNSQIVFFKVKMALHKNSQIGENGEYLATFILRISSK